MTNPMPLRTLICLLVALTSHGSLAADPELLMAVRGKVLFEDDFTNTELGPQSKWIGGIDGGWTIKDGVLTWAKGAGHNGGFLRIRPELIFKDVIVEFAFKIESGSQLDIGMDDSAFKAESQGGHILRATVRPTQCQVVDYKLGVMKWEYFRIASDPKSTRDEKRAVDEKCNDKFGTFKTTVEAGQWHQARVEVVGDEILMSLDNKPAAYLKSGGIDHPTKNQLSVSTSGASVSVKALKFSAATAAPGWQGKHADVIKQLPR